MSDHNSSKPKCKFCYKEVLADNLVCEECEAKHLPYPSHDEQASMVGNEFLKIPIQETADETKIERVQKIESDFPSYVETEKKSDPHIISEAKEEVVFGSLPLVRKPLMDVKVKNDTTTNQSDSGDTSTAINTRKRSRDDVEEAARTKKKHKGPPQDSPPQDPPPQDPPQEPPQGSDLTSIGHQFSTPTYSGSASDSSSKSEASNDRSNYNSEANRHSHNTRSKDALSGILRDSDDDTVAVTFKVIVPKKFWVWDENSKIYLRFGHHHLGNWKENIGGFETIREDDVVAFLQCTLNIVIELVQDERPIAYKYLVCTSSCGTKKDSGLFEYIHQPQPPSGVNYINRCLIVSRHSKGKFYQYDGMIFPEKQPKGKLEAFGAAIRNFFSSTSEDKELSKPNYSLLIHLEHHKKIFCCLEVTENKQTIQNVVNSVYDIYEQCQSVKFCYDDCFFPENVSKVSDLHMVFLKWLIEIIKELYSMSPSVDNGKRMVSVISIICLLSRLKRHNQIKLKDITLKDVSVMLSMLVLKPDFSISESPKCEELRLLSAISPNAWFPHVVSAIIEFTNYFICCQGQFKLEWIFVLPLIHILNDETKPFGKPPIKSKEIKWKDVNVNMKHVKVTEFPRIEHLFDDLQPLIKLDPLLLPQLVSICPTEMLPSFIELIPIYLSAAWLSHWLNKKKSRYLNVDEVNYFRNLMQSLMKCVKKESQLNFDEVEATYDAVRSMSFNITTKFSDKTPLNISALHEALEILLHSAHKLLECASLNSNQELKVKERISKLFKDLFKQLMDEWIVMHYGKAFGHPSRNNKKFLYAEQDLKDFDALARIDCPPELQSKWHNETLWKILRIRVSRVNVNLKIELIVILEKFEKPHHLITEVFTEAVMQCFEETDLQKSMKLEKLYIETIKYRDTVGKIVDKVIKKKYPSDSSSIPLDDILQWELWPVCITIHRSESMIKKVNDSRGSESCLPERCDFLCSLANSTLMDILQRITDGSITIMETRKINEKLDQVEKLCSAATSGSSESREFKLQDIKASLELRISEYKAFEKHKNMLAMFCREIEPRKLNVQDFSELMQQLQKNYNQVPLHDLCHTEPSDPREVQFLCFDVAHPLHVILTPFEVLFKTRHSDIFLKIWRSKLKEAERAKEILTFDDVVAKIWNPVFEECCKLLDGIQSRSIKLKEVDKYFRGIEHINDHLKSLYYANEECLKNPRRTDCKWISVAVFHIEQYWSLCEQAKAAKVVLELKQRLDLTGNFEIIEAVAGKVTTSMKEEALDAIDQRLIKAKSFLEQVTSKKNMDCLEKFAECLNVVDWMRKETKEVNDLHKFVSVALHTSAGEGDLSSDKLSHLKTVASGFAPLIYGLKKDSSFEAFQQGCEVVWKTMMQTPNLPELLVTCNQDLEWYKSVKETQASVEVSSYGQMNNIFKYGCYSVGTRKSQICQNYHEVIHLTMKERDKRLAKKSYNLEELRDLESKLVLITGSKAENRAQVDLFLDTLHSICRIAEVLITLQQVGNVKYMGWILQIPCSTSRQIILDLQNQAKCMEQELDNWREMVKDTRGKIYELNYYTTLQLLTLRRELGKIKTFQQSSRVKFPAILPLLQSISTQITSDDVISAVHQVIHSPEAESVTDLAEQVVYTPERMDCPIDVHTPFDEISDEMEILPKRKGDTCKPSLTENDLTEEQKETMTNVINRLYCSKTLVLKAFEKCQGNEDDKYDYERWCVEHMDEDMSDDERSVSSGESSPHSDSDSEAKPGDEESTYSKGSVGNIAAKSPAQIDSSPRIITIDTTICEPIDETHPAVMKLIEADFSVEQSIEAVERCGGDPGTALEYLENQIINEGEIEDQGKLFPLSYKHELSHDDSSEDFKMEWSSSDLPTIKFDSNAEKSYLNLEEIGNILRHISHGLPCAVRPFSLLRAGHPNLLVLQPDKILKATLSLYMEGFFLPLPSPEEVLVCNSSTTSEEVELFWMRAVKDPGFRRIFCLVHGEKLSYQVSDKALRSLDEHTQGRTDYRLVIICSNEEEEKSHFISKLHLFRRHFVTQIDLQEYRRYLTMHFTSHMQMEESFTSQYATITSASVVDHERSCVRIVTSERSGMGKSLYIKRLTENLQKNLQLEQSDCVHVTIPLHSPVVTPDTILELFKDHMDKSTCYIYHIDIAPNILCEVDTILFSLLILRGMSDSQGRVWHCHPNQLYAVEVTLPNRDHIPERDKKFFPESRTLSLLELLPTVSCLSPRNAMQSKGKNNSLVLMDDEEFRSDSYQRVYQYIRRHAGGSNLDNFTFRGIVEGQSSNCIEMILHHCGVRDPSWSEIRHFMKFLDLQLQSCEESVFTDSTLVGDIMSGIKDFIVKFMIRMSRDFSTSSLCGEIALEMGDVIKGGELDQYQISERRRWEQSPHPYIFFNEDRISITFVGFTVTPSGDLVDPTNQRVLEHAIMTPQLYTGLRHNKVNFKDDYRCWKKHVMIEKLCTVMGVDYPHDPDESYVLTVDNLIKILAIQMRFRCGIPVVIMGETGCGKTRLIRYMCDLARQGTTNKNMLILKVHGGTTEEKITQFIQTAEQESEKNRVSQMDTVVFFDEANTTDAIGLIKEIMCDRRMNGKPISDDIKFIAACNPYRKHSEDMIRRLENAGLGFFVRATETQQKLGKIPLRQLVYRVLDLPPSMRPLVYDFGQLNTETESYYVKQIVFDHIQNHSKLSRSIQSIQQPIAQVLVCSQLYMKKRKDECSFVSLRDVERAMIVFENLYDMMEGDEHSPGLGALMDEWAKGHHQHIDNEDEEFDYQSPGPIARALVLSVSVCYHARLQEREEYEQLIAKCFTGPILLQGVQQFRDEIRWCQEILLDSMQLGDNIAKNAALRENVFMMTICVELRIPLFLVGKPGSSKSLAKSIINDSMRGKHSKNELLKKFKEVGIFSYQCSQLSTPESVIEVFHNADRFQKMQGTESYVAVVVLDEVGLAEDSPNLPLKSLHPLLEDGTEGASSDKNRNYSDKIIDRPERVAFIGISNWALDPAKMNRGVMVTRADPSEEELEFSAKEICSNVSNDPIRKHLEPYFKPFARAFKKICSKQEREFFGLRDFYSLIKMLYYMCKKTRAPPTWQQLEHAIKRNFGGLESEKWKPIQEFEEAIPMSHEIPDLTNVPEELHSIINPDCSRLGLIKASLSSREKTWHGENRYMLFLTENYAALDILKNPKNYLSDKLTITDVQEESMDLSTKDIQPFILFGSSFPKDKEYTQVCRNINQIKICMETGRTVILLNLENLYESLYDVLNQYYIYHGDSRYVDLGLQTHRVRCRVDKDFKLILIAEKDTVYERFPTPLINRLEKHFVLTSSVLEDWQEEVLNDFEDWIKAFSDTGDSKFKKSDAFIGFQKDTPASVIFQATNQLRSACAAFREGECTKRKWECILVWSKLSPQDWDIENVDNNAWKNAVLQLSKYLLLQTASPDAIVRLEYTRLEDDRADIAHIYFHEQHHSSIDDIMNSVIHESDDVSGLLVQVTTHSHLLSYEELKQVERATQCKVASFFLHEFDTELDFSNKVSPMFKTAEDGSTLKRRLVIIQCDSGHLNGDLIACARYRIYDLRTRADFGQITHVLFIIHLPHQVSSSSFVGFQGDPWISAHIDDLRPTSGDAVADFEAIGSTISELFLGVSITKRQRKESKKEDEEPGNLNQFESNPAAVEEEGTYRNKVEVEGLGDDSKSGISRSHAFIGSSEEMTSDDEEEKERDKKQELWAERVQDSKDSDMESEESLSQSGNSNEMSVEDIESDELEYRGIPEKMHDNKNIEANVKNFMNNDVSSLEPTQLSFRYSTTHHLNIPHHSPSNKYARETSRSPLFKRLYGCIQAAASRLKDVTNKRSTRRVEILVHLIPKEPPNTLVFNQFHGVLVQHIFEVLQEREEVFEGEKWVIKEAMNARNLQHGGTFRNALSRKVDEVVTPIFAEIIASVDRNYNLDLIDPKNENSPISKFWLSIFSDSSIMQFNYRDMVTPREQVPGVGGRKTGEDFKCELPFSWLIYDAVDSQWDNAKSLAGNDKSSLQKQLCDSIEPTPVGGVLRAVNQEDCEDFYKKYLNDFVRIVHRCNHNYESQEYELISSALDDLVHGDEFCSIDGNITVIDRISTIHVVYQLNKSKLLWFGQLVSCDPGIIVRLKSDQVHDRTEMVLHLHAVEKALESLDPLLDRENPAINLIPWLNDVRLFHNAITSIIDLPSQSAIKTQSRLKWEVIRTMQLFLEHVLLKHEFENSVAYLIRLQLHLKNQRDFKEVSTLKKIQSHINLMVREVKKKKLIKKSKEFRRHCHSYFMEVVSTLCFGGQRIPEPDLIRMLMQIIFMENPNSELTTQDLTPLTDGKVDEVPVVRSSLLQLLLEHNSESVKEHLKEYFDRSQKVLAGSHDEDLCLLCIQCFEDALYKENSNRLSEEKIEAIYDTLRKSYDVLKSPEMKKSTVHYLEAIAGFRFAFLEIANLLHSEREDCIDLFELAKDVCTDPVINTSDFTVSGIDVVGPAVYLLKLLVRKYGFPCLKQVYEKFNWIIPEGLRETNQEKVIDPFVLYNDTINYSALRETVSEAVFGKQIEKLVEATKDSTITEAAVLLLVFYKSITMSHSSPKKLMDEESLESFNQFTLDMKAFSPPMLQMARLLLTNEQGGSLAQMRISPELPLECKTLGSIVVHAISIFNTMDGLPILLPFINMMTKPAALKDAYLPTMRDDILLEVKALTGGQYYYCPRGHPYFVDMCGKPREKGKCDTCGALIGRDDHKLRSDNAMATIDRDTTQKGHDLGSVESRTCIPSPERSLSPRAVCIMRALMHSALLWCSCHHEDCMASLAELVKPYVDPQHLPEFFWRHLQKDIEHLSQVTGKGLEEAAIIVHLILKDILTKPPPTSDIITTVNSLRNKNAREHWEREFSNHYIQPVLGNLDKILGETMDLIANDDKQDHDQLFYLVYERVKVNKDNMEPHLWSYRQRISLEHLSQTLQEKKLKEKYPILHEFLRVEPSLRATQYLPDIIKLQQCLYDTFNHRLDRKDAKTQTIREFLNRLKSENSRNEYRQRIESLKKAWLLVGQDLNTHGRLRLEERHCLPAITEDVALEYLIPTFSGAGACTTSLVKFLIFIHNSFIDKCHSIAAEQSRSHSVPITHIHHCHLMDYEHQIVSIVLSHCCYSLKLGKANNVEYDHQALEKHILDKFIHGKPMILLSDIPQVTYHKDIYMTVKFDAVRKKVKPQKRLDSRLQKEIIADLRTPDRIRASLDVVDIVLGFLSSGGVKADKSLGEYIDKVLKMKKRQFSQKAREYCKLHHILSLWETLSVELARIMWLRDQEPFDSVKDIYLKDLSKDSDDNQEAALEKCLRTFDLDRLLGALYEFIETHVKYSPTVELKWPLKDILVEDQYQYLGINPDQLEKFPDSICLDQTVAVWKYIVHYQEKLKQE